MLTETQLAGMEFACGRQYRVLHVLDHSWPVLSGYSVRSRSLLKAQLQNGLKPHALTGPLHQLDDAQAADITVDGLPYERTPLSGALRRPALAGGWPLLRELAVVSLLRNRIFRLIDSKSFDIVHAHSPALCGLAAWQAANSRGIPFVYEIRAFWEDAAVDQKKTRQQALRYRATRRLESYVVERADAVVGIAGHILEDLKARGVASEKLFHISNGVDAEWFDPLPRDTALANKLGLGKEPVLGFIGSLYHYEGISWLVGAVAELRRRGVACRLMVLGDGEDTAAIQAAIRKHAAEDYISPMGRVAQDQVPRYYSLMDVMVYPRRSTRLTELVTPLKPLEAMAQGKPVLASAVGGIRELVQHEETGLLFKPESVDDFCQQATRLLEQKSLREQIAHRARQKALGEKEWKAVARGYEAVYEFATLAKESGEDGAK
jgi:glycogen synthase